MSTTAAKAMPFAPILWSYDASPFTQRALRLLAMKQLDWHWVETPMLPPKNELSALTAGYRGTPVLQIGADVYIDSQLIALELERRVPEPSLFPTGDRGLALALVKWADGLFRSALGIVVHATANAWPAEFHSDRRALFADFDWDAALASSTHARGQFRAQLQFLESQLADGRTFLNGAQPGLADAQAQPFIGMVRGLGDSTAALFDGFSRVLAWEARVSALGEGRRRAMPADAALTIAREASPEADPLAGVRDAAAAWREGMLVAVSPDDTRRGQMRGELVRLDASQITIRHSHAACGQVCVHFPRLGYRIDPVA